MKRARFVVLALLGITGVFMLAIILATEPAPPVASTSTATLPASPTTEITRTPAPTAAPASTSPRRAVVLAEVLHLRQEPSLNGRVIGYLYQDQVVMLAGVKLGDWQMLADPGGYVHSAYIRIIP